MPDISFHKGETLGFELSPQNGDGSAYVLAAGDKVVFVAAERFSPRRPLLSRTLTAADCNAEGKLFVSFSPEETAALSPGVYKYDCGLQTAAGDFHIFIPPSNLIVKPANSKKEATE